LDIHLEGSASDGISLAQEINTIKPIPIIYTTSMEDKAVFERAKSTNPFAFLIKPIDKKTLQSSIELSIHHFAQNNGPNGSRFASTDEEDPALLINGCFYVKTAKNMQKVRFEDVYYVDTESDRYCRIVTKKNIFRTRTSLQALSIKLPAEFVRVHRNYIVNLNQVDAINEKALILSVSGNDIPINKSKKSYLLKKLQIF
ncbi:MAG: LytR/AlgR family response regulator transcription factor, partial [Cyclobacteriaceae bacterium]